LEWGHGPDVDKGGGKKNARLRVWGAKAGSPGKMDISENSLDGKRKEGGIPRLGFAESSQSAQGRWNRGRATVSRGSNFFGVDRESNEEEKQRWVGRDDCGRQFQPSKENCLERKRRVRKGFGRRPRFVAAQLRSTNKGR